MLVWDFDSVSGNRDGFAAAAGAPAGTGQTGALTEDELAVLACGRLHDKPARSIPSQGSYDMEQVVFDLALREGEHSCELAGRILVPDERFDEMLSGGQFGHRPCHMRAGGRYSGSVEST